MALVQLVWLTTIAMPMAFAQDLDPQLIGRWSPSAGSVESVLVRDGYAYAALGGAGLAILDVRNAARPARIGRCETAVDARHLALSGQYACLAGKAVLELVDVSNPTDPRVVGTFNNLAGTATSLAASGSHAYVSIGNSVQSGLRVLNISNPANPQLVGSVPMDDSASDVEVSGGIAYVTAAYLANGGEGLQVIGLSPANPRRIATTGGVAFQAVEVQGGLAYLAPWDKPDLLVMDVSDVRSPRTVGEYDITDQRAGRIQDIAVSGSHAFAAIDLENAGGSLQVLDISRPEKPQWVGSHEFSHGSVFKVVLAPPYACVLAKSASGEWPGGGLFVIDVSDPLHPNQVGEYPSHTPTDVAVSGRYAFMTARRYDNTTAGQGGLRVFDVGEARDPRVVAIFEERKTFSAVRISGGLAYVVDEADNLSILDIAQPGQPQKVGEVSLGEWTGAHDIMVSGDYTYVLGDVLTVVDVGDPANPRRVGGNTGVDGYEIAFSGGHLFVAGETLQILNVFTELRLGPAMMEADGKIRLPLKGPSGQRIRVQRSANLVDWEDWQAVTLGESGSELVGNTRDAPYRFYRSVIE